MSMINIALRSVKIAVRSYHGRGVVFKIVMSVANFEHSIFGNLPFA